MTRKIIVRGNPLTEEAPLVAVGSSGNVKPGHMLERARPVVSSTPYPGVQKVSAATDVNTFVAVNRTVFGRDTKNTVEAVTANASLGNAPGVLFAKLRKGDVFYARVAAAAPAIVYGDTLALVAGGTVAKATTNIKFMALEDVNNSSGSTEDFVKCEVL